MKRLLRLPSLLRLTLVFLFALLFQNCTEQQIKETTDDTPNITEYLRSNPDYSMFLEILDITGYAPFMNTYGTYTMFLPTNDAVKQYLSDLGVNSLKDVPVDDLKEIAKLHILDLKIETTLFTDGKINTPTLQGQYLLTGASTVNGISSTTVNKTSNIVVSNIMAGNGVIHAIDKVLRVADKTLAASIEADANLSLFTEVLKATGWYEKLNKPVVYDENKVGSFLSVLSETNEVFSKAGYNSLDDLKNRYSHLDDPTNLADSLNLFVQYHILPNLNYLSDMAINPVFETKAPLEVISSKLDKQTILLNHDIFNGVQEEGVKVVRAASDETSSNGVLHYVDGHFTIKKRVASPVYFDLCDQPEMIANAANYRKPGGSNFGFTINGGGLSNVTWTGSKTYEMIWFRLDAAVNGDMWNIFRFRHGNGGGNNLEFVTPVLIKGRYKIWVSYKYNAKASNSTAVFFNGEQTSRILNQREGPNDPFKPATAVADRVLESQGYKRYIYPHVQGANLYSRFVGIVEVATTGKHKIKFVAATTNGSAGGADLLDMVEFRPVDMDQIWPKFKSGVGGGLVQREDAPTDN